MIDAISELASAVSGIVLSDELSTRPFRQDRSGYDPDGSPLAVVEALSVEDVQAVCTIAQKHGLPIVARGAGSGYSGGASAGSGSIVLSLTRMDSILATSASDECCVVEPGVITSDISRSAARLGLYYAPDPASAGFSTIGGNIATNAGGLCCVKYGVTRGSVLALDVVLADGSLIHTGHRSIKGVAGYDLTSLFVGSEGTLGIIVGATLRLQPIPLGQTQTICAFFSSAVDAAQASVSLSSTRVRPSMLELIDEVHLERIDEWRGTTLRNQGAACLIIQTDGLAADREAQLLVGSLHEFGAVVEVTTEQERVEEILNIRRWTSEESPARSEVTLNEDIAVPRSALVDIVRVIQHIREEYGVILTLLSHVGDGNLHANFRVPTAELDANGSIPRRVWDAADELVSSALRLGGTITGEHGIGILKARWLRNEIGDRQYELQKRVRETLDPHRTFNPGKVLVG